MEKPTIYELFLWSESQYAMSTPDSHCIDVLAGAAPDYDIDLDSAWMAPKGQTLDAYGKPADMGIGAYIRVEFPDSQAHDENEGVLFDIDGGCYVPLENLRP